MMISHWCYGVSLTFRQFYQFFRQAHFEAPARSERRQYVRVAQDKRPCDWTSFESSMPLKLIFKISCMYYDEYLMYYDVLWCILDVLCSSTNHWCIYVAKLSLGPGDFSSRPSLVRPSPSLLALPTSAGLWALQKWYKFIWLVVLTCFNHILWKIKTTNQSYIE